jgi:PAS domain S-box-containing protein
VFYKQGKIMKDTHSLRTIADLKSGDHRCCIYETEEEHRAVLAPFLRQGLEQHEKVFYIVDARTAEMVLGYLRDDGVDVDSYIQRGQLAMLTRHETYIQDGVFDPTKMIAMLRTETARALDEGYTALRVTGEMTWALRGLPSSERLIEYEIRLSEFLPGSQCLAICQYDRRRFFPDILLDVLRTHPIAVIGTEVYENFYYIPPDQLLSGDLQATELRNWTQNLAKRQQTKVALRESEEKFRSIINSSNDVIVLMDGKGKLFYVNEAIERVLGYSVDEYLDGYTTEEIVHPSDVEKIRDGMKRLQTGVEKEVELLSRMKHKDGTYRWIESRAMNLLDNKYVRGMLMIFRDVTERKTAEKAINAYLSFLNSTMEQSPFAMWISETTGTVVRTNNALRETLNLTDDQIVGKYNVLQDDNLNEQGVMPQVRAVFEEQRPARFSIPWVGARAGDVDFEGARDLWIDVSMFPIVDSEGNLTNVVCQWVNVTERKQAEDALWESEEKHRILFETMAQGVVYQDVEGRIISANPAAERLLGLSLDQMLGRTSLDPRWHAIHEDGSEFPGETHPSMVALQTGKEVRKVVMGVFNPQADEYRWINIHAVPQFKPGQDAPYQVYTTFDDITERKQAEEQLKKSLREKEVLLQELYHRTKNNMNVIGAMLSMQANDFDDQRLARVLEEIKQRIISMALVHEQLYESQDLSHVNLKEYTQQLANSLLATYQVGPGNVVLKVEVEPIVVLIETAIPYGLIVNELMTNALKHAFPEGRDGEIRIGLHRLPGEKELELRFHDNGIGMPEDLDIRKTKSFGMKLIMLLIDMQFKGTVEVQVNTGTEFRIRFRELNYKARV